LFGLLFALIALEGGVGLKVLASFRRSTAELTAMQAAGMRIDEFGLALNNFVKEMKVSSALEPEGGGATRLPPTAALVEGARSLAERNRDVRSPELEKLLAGLQELTAAAKAYQGHVARGAADDATLLYIQTLEPLADGLLDRDFPSSREAVMAAVERVSQE